MDSLWKGLLVGLVALAGAAPAITGSETEKQQAKAGETPRAATEERAREPAPGPGSLPYLEALPPLIDRHLFFGDPEISASQVSPDGRHISFIKPYEGVPNVWVKARQEPFDAARPITADDRPVPDYFWSEDGAYVLYVQDKEGDEDYHVYAVDPTAEPEEGTGVPPARDLTPLEDVRAYIYAVPERTPGQILIGLNDRDPALHDVHRLDITTGERRLLIKNEQNVADWVTDLDGKVRLAVRQRPDGGTEILAVEKGKLGEVVYGCDFGEVCFPIRFHKDGERVYLETNKGEEVDLSRLVLFDPATGKTELVESDPEGEVDFGSTVFSDATEELIATTYVGDRLRIYPKAEKVERALRFLRSELPEGEISFGSMSNDDRWVKVVLSRDVDPGTVYLLDWQEMRVQKLYEWRGDLPKEHLAPMRVIRYLARDGQEIPAYLTVPKDVEAKDFPVVVNPHGGPWSRDVWGYDSLHQFLANRGYAVFSMNFRGSTGYGKAFLNAGNKEWGTGIMQHDITDGVRYLIEQGIADPDRVCIMGGSYGGYATLAGLTFTPDLYACGVDIVGPSNLITLLNSVPAYWGPFRKELELRVGDPDHPEEQERLKAQSPLFQAAEIAAPLLVVQGANDPRVKKAEADQIVIALRDAGHGVDYLVAPDEGHGFRAEKNRLAMYAKTEEFLATHLGGRYQKEMAPEVAERLAAITVDPASLEMPKLASGADAARTAPLPAVDARKVGAGELSYTSVLSVQGREMTIESTRAIRREERDGEEVLVIESRAQTPAGPSSDTFVLDADSLRPVSRSASQGAATIKVEYGDGSVTGLITAGPQEMPIDVELEAPVFGDEAALETVVTALPLEEGYGTTLRTFEVGMQQRTRLWSLGVTGAESVATPAGSFETLVVTVEPLDGEGGDQIFWVTRALPRTVVRIEGKLPAQMGSGTVTTELTAAGEAAAPGGS